MGATAASISLMVYILPAIFVTLSNCFSYYYDHSFPLRYKALTRDETEGVVRSNEIFVRIVVRKQANYRARGGEWAQPFSLTELLCVPDILSSTNK